MKDNILPLAAMERILRTGAPEIRVSELSRDALREVLEEQGMELAKRAAKLAVHAGRKTIKAEDVRLAIKQG